MGVELVADKARRTPFPTAAKVSKKIADTAFSNGLITGAGGGGIDGILGDHINLAPPFTCSEADLDEIIEILRRSIVDVQTRLSR